MNRIIFYVLIMFISFLPSYSKANDDLSKIITQAENYMNNLRTMQARFIQTTWNGTRVIGTFYLSRPGKLRFDYDPPIKDFVVADGSFIYFYDSEMEEQTNAPIGNTLANFMLKENFSLVNDKSILVDEVSKIPNMYKIKLVKKSDVGAGSLTLGFSDDPFEIKKWRVVDAQGTITEVELFKIKKNIELDKKLFIYRNPVNKTKQYND